MTNFDNSWRALTQPGAAERFFDADPLPRFEPHVCDYSPTNAWWLAELSRLSYRHAGRDDILARIGWREQCFIDQGHIQYMLVGPRDPQEPPFTILVFRGSSCWAHWWANFNTFMIRCSTGGCVHRGFSGALDRVWDRLRKELDASRGPVFHAGHSLGGALAVLAAARRPPTAVYTYGCPRVGDADFAQAIRHVPVHCLVNNTDLVAAVPPVLGPLRFSRHGDQHLIQRDSSKLVNPNGRRPRATPHASDTRSLFQPPRFLADHAPVNYVAHLQRALG